MIGIIHIEERDPMLTSLIPGAPECITLSREAPFPLRHIHHGGALRGGRSGGGQQWNGAQFVRFILCRIQETSVRYAVLDRP